MKYIIDLPAGEQAVNSSIEGRYVQVLEAQGEIAIQYGNAPDVELERFERVDLGEQAKESTHAIGVKNLSGTAQTVVLFCSDFYTSKKRPAEVGGASVSINSGSNVGLDEAANKVKIDPAHNTVKIAPVKIDAAQNTVKIDHGSASRPLSVTREAASGTIAVGARYIEITAINAVDYELAGTAIPHATKTILPLLPKGESYPETAYDPKAAGELLITVIR